MQWDSAAYLRFKAERTQPSIDLVKRIDLEQPRKLLDVGCGPGNSTQVLADAFPNALRIIGIDSSPEMIEAAKDDHPDMEFRICDALNLPSLGEDGFDVVFSNACIQWVPDHPRLIRDMLALLRPGGMLAVQVPMNYQEPIHRIIGELAASDEWRAELASARIFHTLSQEAYFDILAAEAGQFQMWQITYLHRMPSHEAIMDWYKGTGLRPYLSLLSGERRSLRTGRAGGGRRTLSEAGQRGNHLPLPPLLLHRHAQSLMSLPLFLPPHKRLFPYATRGFR